MKCKMVLTPVPRVSEGYFICCVCVGGEFDLLGISPDFLVPIDVSDSGASSAV